ncbi:2'-5' RNA ligase family protein [Microbacterium sp. NPDC055903]
MRRPIMDTPQQLASLEGQQYLVLRPTGAVAETFRTVQDAAIAAAGQQPITWPHTEHVTLRGFFEPHRREEVAAVIRAWAAERHPIEIVADAVDSFPSPWQIILVRLARTATLTRAYADLTRALGDTDLRRLDERPLEEWTFHLSAVYAKLLDAARWAELERASVRELAERPSETIAEAEFVWYEGGVEHAEIVPFGASA